MNHCDYVKETTTARMFRIFGETGHTDLLVPADQFRARNIELRELGCNFAVVDKHTLHKSNEQLAPKKKRRKT